MRDCPSTHPNARRPSSAWTVQKRSVSPTSPLMGGECSAVPSRYSWVSGATGGLSLEIASNISANLCPAASTSSGLLEARPGDGTLHVVIRFTSRLCVACLNMHPLPWLTATTSKHERVWSWKRPEPSPAWSALPQLKQSSQSPGCHLFQRISKPYPSQKPTSGPIFHQQMIVDKPSSPHADSA